MKEWSADALVNAYFAVSFVIVLLLAWNGWRQGVLRQLVTLTAIVSAYVVGWFGAESAAPLFWFLHFPAQLTSIVGGVVSGFAAFIGIRTVGLIVCKRTAQQKPGATRMSYGFLGALIGLLFGSALFFVASSAVRMLGGIAKAGIDSFEQEHNGQRDTNAPSSFISGLAKLSTALESSSTGQFLRNNDPLPTERAFATLTKLGIMVSRADAVERFSNFPGISELTNHPKITALKTDPEISDLLASKSYFRLLRHDKIVSLANDPVFAAEIKMLDFDKALDFALRTSTPHRTSDSPPPFNPLVSVIFLPIHALIYGDPCIGGRCRGRGGAIHRGGC
jgi:hypothetical protein